jgi:hypothetical protein
LASAVQTHAAFTDALDSQAVCTALYTAVHTATVNAVARGIVHADDAALIISRVVSAARVQADAFIALRIYDLNVARAVRLRQAAFGYDALRVADANAAMLRQAASEIYDGVDDDDAEY